MDERTNALLEELLAWTRFAHRDSLLRLWSAVLSEPRHLLAYELSDGTRTQKQIGDSVGLSQPAISGLWQRWRRLGIARDANGRVAHIARPSDMGVDVPQFQKQPPAEVVT